MHHYQQQFLNLAVKHQVLKFGSFTLKSGRVSPYFFNLGKISSGAAMLTLAESYAEALLRSGIGFDMLFGPAYKGIPLVTAVACALAQKGHDVPFAYNRKEAKAHGEGGTLVGAAVEGRVVIIDDVLTAGTALREAVGMIRAAGAHPVAALIALDRQERGNGVRSAVQEMQDDTGVTVLSLVSVTEIMAYLGASDRVEDQGIGKAVQEYHRQYGAT